MIGLNSPEAVQLLLGTAAQESHMGRYLRQINGPALGIFQMEPTTHDDIWTNYLQYRTALSRMVSKLRVDMPIGPRQMAGNLYYAAAMARIHYRRVPEPLPQVGDLSGMAEYWKKHYNTHLGAGTEDEFIANYERFV